MLAKAGVIAQTHKVAGNLGYYRTVTIDQPASDLTNFPVLFNGTYTYLKTTGNGGKVRNSNGYDIVFYSDSGLTTKLKFERVFWDATTGDVEFWVKIPTLTSASATVIYIAYGNPIITTDQQDAVNTWNTNDKAVYHFPDGTTLNVNDSTGNFNGVNNSTTASTGQIDGAVNIAVGQIAVNLNFGTIGQPFSLSGWIKPSGIIGFRTIVGGQSPSGAMQLRLANATNAFQLVIQAQSLEFATTGIATAAVWTRFTLTVDGSNNVKVYINNAAAETGTKSGTAFSSDASFIGSNSGGGERFAGDIDELRVTDNIPTADWVAAEYSNQNDPANFYVLGSEVAA